MSTNEKYQSTNNPVPSQMQNPHIFFFLVSDPFTRMHVCVCASVEGERENIRSAFCNYIYGRGMHAMKRMAGAIEDRRCRSRKHSHTRSANTIFTLQIHPWASAIVGMERVSLEMPTTALDTGNTELTRIEHTKQDRKKT